MTKKWTKYLEKFEKKLESELFAFEMFADKTLENTLKWIDNDKEKFEKFVEGSLYYDNISGKEYSTVYRKMWDLVDEYRHKAYELNTRKNKVV